MHNANFREEARVELSKNQEMLVKCEAKLEHVEQVKSQYEQVRVDMRA
jgi:hypothetical protein